MSFLAAIVLMIIGILLCEIINEKRRLFAVILLISMFLISNLIFLQWEFVSGSGSTFQKTCISALFLVFLINITICSKENLLLLKIQAVVSCCIFVAEIWKLFIIWNDNVEFILFQPIIFAFTAPLAGFIYKPSMEFIGVIVSLGWLFSLLFLIKKLNTFVKKIRFGSREK